MSIGLAASQGTARHRSLRVHAIRSTIPYDAERAFNARRALELVKSVAGWMTDIHGRRKSLLSFSEGIDYDIYDVFNNRSATSVMQDARDPIAAAQRANVGIYAVDPRGLTQLGDETIAIASLSDNPQVREGSPAAFQRELLLAQESLITLADETGGMAVVRTNDIPGALARIASENSTYYLLGYHTDASRSPGRFRKIEVRVKRPGLQVRARRGYVPPDPKALAKTREAEARAGTSPRAEGGIEQSPANRRCAVACLRGALQGCRQKLVSVVGDRNRQRGPQVRRARGPVQRKGRSVGRRRGLSGQRQGDRPTNARPQIETGDASGRRRERRGSAFLTIGSAAIALSDSRRRA